MAAPMDIGLSVAASSAAQSGGDFFGGDVIVGGSGGVNRVPGWVWLGVLGVAFVGVFWFLLRKQ